MFVILLNKRRYYEKYSQNEFMSLQKLGNQLELIDIQQDEFDCNKSRVNYSYQNLPKATYQSWAWVMSLGICIIHGGACFGAICVERIIVTTRRVGKDSCVLRSSKM